MTEQTNLRKALLKEVLSIQSSSGKEERMIEYISKFCKENVPSAEVVIKENNIYITKGSADFYPCIVSHTDTVHTIHKEFKVFEDDDCLFAFNVEKGVQVGIGGDDKVGIWIALQSLLLFDNIKCAFFHSEEIGCVGSSAADMEWFDNVGYCFQADRKGNNDFVNDISGSLYSEDFSKKIKTTLNLHGYSETSGGMTDVMQLAENGIDVCVANMSCGYYAPHSDQEIVEFNDANNTLSMVINLICVLGESLYPNVYTPSWAGWNTKSNNYAYAKDWGDFSDASEGYWYGDKSPSETTEVVLDEFGNETCYYCGGMTEESSFGIDFRFCGDCNSDVFIDVHECEVDSSNGWSEVKNQEYYNDLKDVSDNYDGRATHAKHINEIVESHWGLTKTDI